MMDRFFDQSSHFKLISILIVLAFVVLMLGNDAITLTHPDEVFYAQSAREMMAHNDWMTPYIFDHPQFEKPIMFYWLLVVAFKWFGVNSFSARFWPGIFGIIGVVATYAMAFMLFRKKKIAFNAGFILTTSSIYFVLARSVLTDMVFSIWVVLSLVFFYYGYTNPSKRPIGIIFFFICSALAVLTKGVLGFLFPFIIAGIFLIRKKEFEYFNNWPSALGILLFLAIVLPWHWKMLQLYGNEFIREYWNNVHVRRIIEAEHQKSNTWYFYLGTIVGGMLPWSFFVFPAALMIWKRFKLPGKERPHQLIFPLIWIGSVYLIMQSAQSKLASYIFPLFPAVAIVIAHYFDEIETHTNHLNLIKTNRFCSYLMAGLFFVIPIAVFILARQYDSYVTSLIPIYIFMGLSFICSFVIAISIYKKQLQTFILTSGALTCVILIMVFGSRHSIETWVSCADIGRELREVDQSKTIVLSSKFFARAVRYYSDKNLAVMDINGKGFFSPHPIPFLNQSDQILKFLSSQPETYCVLKKSDRKAIERIAGERFVIKDLSQKGGKYLLYIKPKRNS